MSYFVGILSGVGDIFLPILAMGLFFFFFFFFCLVSKFSFKKKMDKFVLKTWISSTRVSYFVSILSGVEDIFLPSCPQVFFP